MTWRFKAANYGASSLFRKLSSVGSSEMKDQVVFKVGDACRLVLSRGDITKWSIDGQTDAIVNAANERMLGGGGVDGAIHHAAGRELYDACKELPSVSKGVRCPTGEAVVTPAFQLGVTKIIHTVGPIYSKSTAEECALLLESSYKKALELARKEGLKYIAFPAISCGIYGYPMKDAAVTALKVVTEEFEGLKEVHFVLFEAAAYDAWTKAAEEAGLEKSDGEAKKPDGEEKSDGDDEKSDGDDEKSDGEAKKSDGDDKKSDGEAKKPDGEEKADDDEGTPSKSQQGDEK